MQFLASPQLPIPAGAASASITGNTSSWTNSSWVQLTASISVDAMLASIAVHSAVAGFEFEVDIGVGGAGSEAVLTTIRGMSNPPLTNTGDSCDFELPIFIDGITAGDRLAARVRSSVTGANSWTVCINVVEVPYDGFVLTSANPIKVVPSAASATNNQSAITPAWANGSWAELIASAAADLVIVGFEHWAVQFHEFEIGIGSAGSETPVGIIRGIGQNSRQLQTMLHSPWDVIPSGSRIAWRHRNSTFAGGFIALMYMEKPL